jgi:hypothetical protein
MKRIAELEQRRQALLAQIETQRHELAWHAEQFRPTSTVASWARRFSSKSAANHPLAWIAGIAGILLMMKPPRRLFAFLPWLAGALSLLTRVTRVVRLFNELRGARASVRPLQE